MPEKLTIALDVMGGDHGAGIVIPGADLAAERHPNVRFELFGDKQVVIPQLDKYPRVRAVSNFVHTEVAIAMNDKPSQALRRGRGKSSMWLAIDSVKKGIADAAVSAGNTGALMAMAKVILKTVENVDRPAIAAIWPTVKGDSIVLDVGATIGADAAQLVKFSVMGRAMASAIYGLPEPTIGLLNIGQEEVKGLDEIKQAATILRESAFPIDYRGFVEGSDIGKGIVDVVVTEGFSGNIALKTAEGTATQIAYYLKATMRRSLTARIGYVLSRSAFAALAKKLDPRAANGGVFLGLNGIVVKSHGGTDAMGFASAVDLSFEMAQEDLVSRIAADLNAFYNAGVKQDGAAHEQKVSVS